MATERPKSAEPMSPNERGKIVGQFIDWTYDTLLALPEAITALKADCRGPLFAVTPTPKAGRLSFIRNGYVVSLRSNPIDNNPGRRHDLNSAKQSLVVEIGPVVDVSDSDEFLNFHASTTHIGSPKTDVITDYEDGELHIFPINSQEVIGFDKDRHDSSVVDKAKEKIRAMLGITADEPSDKYEEVDVILGLLS